MSTQDRSPGRWLGRRRPSFILVVVVAGVLAAACSGGGGAAPGTSPVASLGGHRASATAAAPLTEAVSDRDMVSFARCMRDHKVAMSDPVHRPGHAGLSIDLPTPDGATRAAYAACRHFIARIVQAKQAGAAARAAPLLAALTRYAQCMRHHDISLPDPTPDGSLNLGHVAGITSDFGRYSPQFRAADTACRHLLPAGIHDDGTGP
jgi:hypothetical protein